MWTRQDSKLVGAAYVPDIFGRGPWEGTSVAVSADANTLLIGGQYDNDVGAAWVFVWPTLKLGTTSMIVGSAAGSSGIMAGSNPPNVPLPWTATTSASWIHFRAVSGTAGVVLDFTYDGNPGVTGVGTISFNNGAATLTVTQAGSTYVPVSQMTTLVSSGLHSPSGVAVDGAGNVYIADTLDYAVKKWTPGTQQLTILDPASMTPLGVAVDKRRECVHSGRTAQHHPEMVAGTAAGDHAGFIRVELPELRGPGRRLERLYWGQGQWRGQRMDSQHAPGYDCRRCVVDAVGHCAGRRREIYIADTQKNTIRQWIPGLMDWKLITSGLNYPTGVAVDGSRNLYIAEPHDNTIKKWTANTQTVSTLISSGLNQPNGVAVDVLGNVYIADTGNNAIKVIWNAYVDPSPVAVPATSGSGALPAVLPIATPFDAQSDQAWLTITGHANGVVSFSYSANPGATARGAHITLLGQSITVTQAAASVPPALGITKSHNGSFTQGQQHATYTLIVSNAANASPTSGTVTVGETMPSGLTLVSMAGSGWAYPGTSVYNCTRGDALSAGASYPPITVTVNVATNAASPQMNYVTVTGAGSQAAGAVDPTNITNNPPVLSIVKSHSGSFNEGQQNATYQVAVSNARGAGPTSGTVTVAETVPSGLTLVSMAGSGWICPGTAANNCTRSDTLPGGASYPAVIVRVNVLSNASSPGKCCQRVGRRLGDRERKRSDHRRHGGLRELYPRLPRHRTFRCPDLRSR